MHKHIEKVTVSQSFKPSPAEPRCMVELRVLTNDPLKLQALVSAACTEIENDDRAAAEAAKLEAAR